MKNLFIVVAVLLFGLSACDNGNYTTNPDNNGQTPNNTTCTITASDTTCSCTDSLSFYAEGELHSRDSDVIALHGTDVPNAAAFAYVTTNAAQVILGVSNYTGVGTYTIENSDASMEYNAPDSNGYMTSVDCGYVKIIVTEDDGTIVKGTFYGIVGREVDYGVFVYHHIKGGRFIAKWIN